MVQFVIFWAATVAIVFFVLSVFFKALASAFEAMGATLIKLGLAGVIIVGGYFGLGILAGLIDFFTSADSIGDIILRIVLLGLGFGVICVIFAFGASILEFAIIAATYLVTYSYRAFEFLGGSCEGIYIKCLMTIKNRLEVC